jgi:hypothetical protein
MAKEGEQAGQFLDEVCELCGDERKYAIKVLSGKRAIVGSNGRKRGVRRLSTKLEPNKK